ncbi:MAG: amidohydrolase family protein [Planctomycetota bacterium]|jgi:predicted TIM-barrel fold metal-dependent hydrolase
MLNRRDVLNLAVSASAAAAFAPRAVTAEEGDNGATFRIVDTNVSLFQWPFRRLPLDETDALVTKLRSLGVAQAWAGSFEGILHRDIRSVNWRLAEACRLVPELVPIGSLNPELPGWEDDLERCIEHGMPGFRLHPNYHGYSLDDARFVDLLKRAARAELFVQIAVSLEDGRTQSNLVRVADVDLTPLVKLLPTIPGARVQLLNHKLRSPLLGQLAKTSGVYFDTARVDSTDGVPKLIQSVPSGRVLFGTHAPFLVPEAALIRTHESGLLDDGGLQAVLAGNADAFRT